MRNSAIPFVTLFGWEVIRALAGYTLVVEAVFDWPGLGSLAILAINQRDFYLIQTIVLRRRRDGRDRQHRHRRHLQADRPAGCKLS